MKISQFSSRNSLFFLLFFRLGLIMLSKELSEIEMWFKAADDIIAVGLMHGPSY